MQLTLQRVITNDQSTIGTLDIDGLFCAFTCEDTKQQGKVPGKTRIPAGTYKIRLRKSSPMASKYAKRIPGHKGMLWLQDVPGFQYVYIHIGNTPEDTEGCILVGMGADLKSGGKVLQSYAAYTKIYQIVLAAIERGEVVTIEVLDG